MAYPRQLDALGAVVAMLARVPDPRERLTAILAVRAEVEHQDDRLRQLLRDAVLELRALDTPATWQEIGDLLHVTAQAALQFAARTINITPAESSTSR